MLDFFFHMQMCRLTRNIFVFTAAIEAYTGYYYVQILGNLTRSDVHPFLHVQRNQQRGRAQRQHNETYRRRNRAIYLHVNNIIAVFQQLFQNGDFN
jgi:hypothetical protein